MRSKRSTARGLCTNDPIIRDTSSFESGEVGGRELGGRAIF
jgi:hypothetical protein